MATIFNFSESGVGDIGMKEASLEHYRSDRRKGVEPIPENLERFLTEEQVKVLPKLEQKGVSLFAVRRPLFQESVVIMKFRFREGYGVLLKDGQVDYFPEIVIRE